MYTILKRNSNIAVRQNAFIYILTVSKASKQLVKTETAQVVSMCCILSGFYKLT